MPVILICVLMFVLWIRYQLNKTRNTDKAANEAFWEQEDKANHTRNKPIDTIEYISVPLNKLPILDTNDPELKALQTSLTDIASEKIADLSAYTNTQLKLAYGTGNFSRLSQFDTNYTILMQTLEKLANYHLKMGHTDAAIAYFDYAIECHSENAQTYVSLAKLYAKQNNTSKIDELKLHLKQSTYKHKDYILRKLEQELLETLI